MFRNLLQRLSQPGSARLWTTFAGLAFAALFVGLDNTILELALPLPDQSGAENSALRWVDRAKAITDWSGTAATTIGFGPFAGLLVVVGTGRTFARRSSKSA